MVDLTQIKPGDKLQVIDGSEAHGDIGTVEFISGDFIMLELDEFGCIWPCQERDVKRVEPTT